MGNSASTGGPQGHGHGQSNNSPARGRTHSPSPVPGVPHRSLRTKKKSLELPDLASLTLTSTSSARPNQPKTPNIPIPTVSGPSAAKNIPGASKKTAEKDPRGRAASTTFSTSDLLAQQTLNNVQYPPRATPYYHAPGPSQQQQQVVQQQRRIQELYNQSNVPAVPVVSYNQGHYHEQGFNPNQEIVRSSIPVALDPQAKALNAAGFLKPVTTKIVWRGGGWSVVLARAGDDEWRGRRVMERQEPGSPIFETTVDLAPGTHHIRFLVDDQWRVADDLPTAVDDQGSLANYVAVPFPKARDPSFFPEDGPELEIPFNPISQEERDEKKKRGKKNKGDQPNPVQAEQWTSILPPELLEAFKEEEMYLAASQGTTNDQDAPNQPLHRISGFVPAPNIPPAPALPRHLDKLILNMRVSPGPAANGIGKTVAPVGNAASVIGSGQSGRNDRRAGQASGSGRGGERASGDTTPQRERRRGRERGLSDVTPNRRRAPPPAPPPSLFSDDGSVMGSSSNLHAILADGTGAPRVETIGEEPPTTPVATHLVPAQIDTSAAPATASSTPGGGTPSTPTPSGSAMGTLTGTSGTNTASSSTAASSNATTPGTASPSSLSAPHPSVVSSRSITIDTSTVPLLTDDASVLPVPSHVVLHHLCTSAIKNGVLAVASTTRYRKKYLTTIYYKPT